MIAAGLGFRPGTDGDAIAACLGAALARAGLQASAVARLATIAARADEGALLGLAAAWGLPVLAVPDDALRGMEAGCATRSTRVSALYGVGSVAEAAALAAAGAGAHLVLPRLVLGPVTCALAEGDGP